MEKPGLKRDIDDLLAAAGRPPEPFPGSVLVYGAGNKGRQVCAALSARGIHVSAVLDAHAVPSRQCAGLPVVAPEDWLANHDAAMSSVVVAIHNENTPLLPILARLAGMGFARVLTPIDLYDAFPDLGFHYWLAPRQFYLPYGDELRRLHGMLADTVSRAWLSAVLACRLAGDYSALPLPERDTQYFPNDLPRWQEPLRFIDCGAYTGDTVLQLTKAGYRFEAIAAFEPDLDNFLELVRNTNRFEGMLRFPCGVSDRVRRIGFSDGQGGGSHIDVGALNQVTCVALDEALPDFRPNLVKMDVEGAEPQALAGGAGVIAASRPALAISLYHHPEHLWRIPFLIEDWKLGYRFYLRGHAHSTFDLVLYALPE